MTARLAAAGGLEDLAHDAHLDVQRVPRADIAQARAVLARDGAVISTGWPVAQDSVVIAAATVLGTRLREVEQVRARTTHDGPDLEVHRDGAYVVVDVHGRPTRLRTPDPDYIQILCAGPARSGGQSYVADGYHLVEQLRQHLPELYAFLTTVDVDLTSGAANNPPHRRPQVCRLIEWTRGGRMVVRTGQSAQPVPREPDAEQHQHWLDTYAGVLAALAAPSHRDTTLLAGELLFLDNYRCLHGVRAHAGARTVHVGRVSSQDAL